MTSIQTILYATDFSAHSRPALQVARSLARQHGARLVLLNVMPDEVVTMQSLVLPADPRLHRRELETMRERIEGPDFKQAVEVHLRQGDPTTEIIEEAEEVGAGQLVVGSHGRAGLARLLMGSVATAVLRRARCPVLTVKDPPAPVLKPAARRTFACCSSLKSA